MNCIPLAMKKRGSLLGCMLLFCYVALAQFNDSTHYHVNYAATGTYNRANSAQSYVLNNGATFDVSKKNVSLNSYTNYIYGVNEGQETNNDFSSTLNFDLFRATRTWSYWGLASYATSYSLKINNQFQAGGGISYNGARSKTVEWSISDGILFETSNLYNQNPGKSTHTLARNSLRVKYHFVFFKNIILDGMHFWQPALNDISDYIVRSNNNLSVALNKWLRVTASLTYNRFNETNSENMLINFGLTVDKYF